MEDKMLKSVIVAAVLLTNTWSKAISAPKELHGTKLAEDNDLTRNKSKLEIKNQRLQEQLQIMQRQLKDVRTYRQIDRQAIHKVNHLIFEEEAKINVLRRSVASPELDSQLQGEVDKLRIDLNSETRNHVQAENRRQTLEEEIEFLGMVHDAGLV